MKLLFPTIFHEFQVPTFNEKEKELIKYVYGEKRKDPGIQKTHRGGWHSHTRGFDEGSSILSNLIVKEVSNYFSQNRILKEGVEIRFTNWWININKKGSFNVKHVHTDSNLSGVFYLKSSKESSRLTFDNPYLFNRSKEIDCYNDSMRDSLYISGGLSFSAIPGTFYIFSSDLFHGVEVSNLREDRISVSFNMSLLDIGLI